MSDLETGAQLAGHRIVAVAGRGGMGVVYRALQLDLDRTVALKVIAPSLAGDQTFRDRFVRESRAAAAIDHPNVIPIYSAGEADGVLYLAMRFVEGPDLRRLVRAAGRLDTQRAARIVAQVAAALDAAHARGLVHRDVKPENVLLGDGDHAYLTDFGLTKRLDSSGGPTRAGGWVGTLGYVAPEQIRGERVDARSDVYALGCLLCFALTGRGPFTADGDEAVLWAHLSADPPRVSALGTGVPTAFDAVIARALAKDPSDRHRSAGDLGRAALAAAGLEVPADTAERSVAVGPAAPVDGPTAAPVDGPTAAPGEGVTLPATPPTPGAPAPRDTPVAPTAVPPRDARPPGLRRRSLLIAAAIAAVAAAGAGIAALRGGGDTASPPAATAAPRSTGVGERPNAIALTRDVAWVARYRSAELAAIDRAGVAPGPQRPRAGAGVTSVIAAFGRIWVANGIDHTVVTLDPATGQRAGAVIETGPGRPVSLAADGRSVWVGVRARGGSQVLKLNPAKHTIAARLAVAYGIQAIAAGGGGVWVLERAKQQLLRIGVADGAQTTYVVPKEAAAIAYGDGAVWLTSDDTNAVHRIDADSGAASDIAVGREPKGIAAGTSGVWVANQLDDTVTRIDLKTGRVVGDAIPVPRNPFAIAADGDEVWVTSLADSRVTRIRVPPG